MSSNWVTVRTSTPSLTIKGVRDGNYVVEVVAIDAFGNRSKTTTSQPVVDRGRSGAEGRGVGLETPQKFAATALSATTVLLTWTPPVAGGLRVAIRHTPDAGGGAWGAASPVTTDLPLASAGMAQVPALGGCYLLVFVNDAGLKSSSISSAPFLQSPTAPAFTVANLLQSADGFSGAKANCAYDSALGALRLSRTSFDAMGAIDSLSSFIDDFAAIVVDPDRVDDLASGGDWDGLITSPLDDYGVDGRIAMYSFSSELDLGNVYDVELIRTIRLYSLALYTEWDSLVGDVDDASDIDGVLIDGGEVSIEFSTAGASLEWTEWAPLTHCYRSMQLLRLRAILAVRDVNNDIAVKELGAVALLPQITEASVILVSSSLNTLRYAFSSKFYQTPSLTISPIDALSGEFCELTSVTPTGFQVSFRNAALARVQRSFRFHAVGYGKHGPNPFTVQSSSIGEDPGADTRLFLWPPGVFMPPVFL